MPSSDGDARCVPAAGHTRHGARRASPFGENASAREFACASHVGHKRSTMRALCVVPLLLASCASSRGGEPPALPGAVSSAPSADAPRATVEPPAAAASVSLAAPETAAPAATAAPVVAPVASAAPVAAPAAPKLNVVLITVDALRADMPWQGYPRNIAPNLTALANSSVTYSRAYSISSYTAMSIGGLLSGRYPAEMERSGYFFSAYPAEEVLFPELLQAAGVRTLGAHAHFYFDQKSGFRQGFDDYRIVEGISDDRTTAREITSPQHLALALELLGNEANTSKQFFSWFHFIDPHDLYLAHPGIKFGGKPRDHYDGEVFFTDQYLGKLFEFIRSQPWGERTAIVVTADHGEAFGEHRMVRHGFELWDPLTHVPLIVHVPGVAPKRIDVPRSDIDLAPTILELMHVPAPSNFQGKSLVAELRGTETPEPRDVILDLPRTSDSFRRRALIHENYKIIAYDDDYRFEVYDLARDPGEKKDLRKTDTEVYEQMKARYFEHIKRIHEVCPKMRDRLKGKRKEKPC